MDYNKELDAVDLWVKDYIFRTCLNVFLHKDMHHPIYSFKEFIYKKEPTRYGYITALERRKLDILTNNGYK